MVFWSCTDLNWINWNANSVTDYYVVLGKLSNISKLPSDTFISCEKRKTKGTYKVVMIIQWDDGYESTQWYI